jgi:hypothetical protein
MDARRWGSLVPPRLTGDVRRQVNPWSTGNQEIEPECCEGQSGSGGLHDRRVQ